jgi:hypothetical protein
MGNQASRIPPALACLLNHWKELGPESLQTKVTQVLLHPGLATVSSGRWGKMAKRPKGRSINYNTIGGEMTQTLYAHINKRKTL